MLELAKRRLAINISKEIKIKKKNNWLNWLINKLIKKGYFVGNICAYGNTQLVGKVQKYGGAYVFWSKTCTGCSVGLNVLKEYENKKKLPTELPCVLLKSALISLKPIKKGDIISLLPLNVNR